ncbi:MAG: tRNA (guanosine(46)-N7)-methyltransferase TrmB, partial [Planctomycetes bacterium]|nr:tRNA (guanosine(46)-N7)-methyltransferase TrmB [Planctomycetota bacterium]
PYFTPLSEISGRLNWVEFFGNGHPVEADIGCGRGKFLFDSTVNRPETNWVGVELDFTEARRGAKRLAKRSLPNGRVIGGDAREFLSKRIEPHSLAAAHVYFPDPWWKRKHRRRRLFTDEFADLLAQAVKLGGFVHSWTDVEDYFYVIRALMDHHSAFIPLTPPPEPEGATELDYLTSFHRRRKQAGCTIWRGLWQRKFENSQIGSGTAQAIR